MPTAIADKPARSLPAHGELAMQSHPRLTMNDLNDPEKFKTLRGIPLIDEHTDKTKGNIDAAKLHLISKNSNDRGAAGNMAAVTLGHTQRKQTIIVLKPDGSRVVLPGVDEQNQPPVIGFASNFHVAPINGKQFMHGDLHIYPEHVSKIREYPFRSIERLEPPEDAEDDGEDSRYHFTDRVSLLKTPPERDAGIIAYERMERPLVNSECDCSDPANALSERCLLRTAYARDLPPIPDDGPVDHAITSVPVSPNSNPNVPDTPSMIGLGDRTTSPNPDPAGANADAVIGSELLGDQPPSVKPTETTDPIRTTYSEAPMPEAPPAAPVAPAEPVAPDPPAAEATATAEKIGDMSKDEFNSYLHDAILNVMMTLMPPDSGEGGGEGSDEIAGEPAPSAVAQYEAKEDPPGIEINDQPATGDPNAGATVGTERTPYAASEAGAMNTFTPAGTGSACDQRNADGTKNNKDEEHMQKLQYQRDIKEINDLKTALAAATATIAAETAARVKYENALNETNEVVMVLVEDRDNAQLYAKQSRARQELQEIVNEGWKVDVEKEVAKITLETPDEVFEERKNEIRTMHARNPGNVRHTIPIGGVSPSGGRAGVMTKDQANEILEYHQREGVSIPEAKKALGYG